MPVPDQKYYVYLVCAFDLRTLKRAGNIQVIILALHNQQFGTCKAPNNDANACHAGLLATPTTADWTATNPT